MGKEKRRVVWNKGGLRSSLWVIRDQREHVPSGSRVHNFPMVGSDQDGTLVGLPVLSGLGPTGPLRLEVGESPAGGDLKLLRQEAYTPVMSKASHVTFEALDITRADVDLAVEPPAPPVKAGTE
nr:hypothetical protein CFP56_25251 [Quercus suber]